MKEKQQIVKPVSLSEQAYRIIKEEIISNEIAPGEQLTEEALASRLSISRTPIRTAIKQLVVEKLAEVNESGKIVVSHLTSKDICDVLAVRMQLEPFAAYECVSSCGASEIKELKKVIAAQKAAKNHEEYLEYEKQFHVAIAKFSDNDYLVDIINDINTVMVRYLTLSGTLDKFSSEAIVEHEAVVEAVEAKDSERAKEKMTEHLTNVEKRMIIGIE